MNLNIEEHLYKGAKMETKQIAKTFKVLSDENRLTILRKLIEGEQCGCTLIEHLEISQPTLSYHLNVLEQAGLTTSKKEGVWKKHLVNQEVLDQLIEYLQSLKSITEGCETHE